MRLRVSGFGDVHLGAVATVLRYVMHDFMRLYRPLC